MYGRLDNRGRGRKALGIAERLEDAGRWLEAVGGISGLLGCSRSWTNDEEKMCLVWGAVVTADSVFKLVVRVKKLE